MKKLLQQRSPSKILICFTLSVLIGYGLLVHIPLKNWYHSTQTHEQLKQQLEQLAPRVDSSNPLQHDPLIHTLIKYAQLHQLEIVSVQFIKNHSKKEVFSCELRGSYFNIEKFINSLFNSSYILTLKELRLRNEANINYLKSSLVFEHEF